MGSSVQPPLGADEAHLGRADDRLVRHPHRGQRPVEVADPEIEEADEARFLHVPTCSSSLKSCFSRMHHLSRIMWGISFTFKYLAHIIRKFWTHVTREMRMNRARRGAFEVRSSRFRKSSNSELRTTDRAFLVRHALQLMMPGSFSCSAYGTQIR